MASVAAFRNLDLFVRWQTVRMGESVDWFPWQRSQFCVCMDECMCEKDKIPMFLYSSIRIILATYLSNGDVKSRAVDHNKNSLSLCGAPSVRNSPDSGNLTVISENA